MQTNIIKLLSHNNDGIKNRVIKFIEYLIILYNPNSILYKKKLKFNSFDISSNHICNEKGFSTNNLDQLSQQMLQTLLTEMKQTHYNIIGINPPSSTINEEDDVMNLGSSEEEEEEDIENDDDDDNESEQEDDNESEQEEVKGTKRKKRTSKRTKKQKNVKKPTLFLKEKKKKKKKKNDLFISSSSSRKYLSISNINVAFYSLQNILKVVLNMNKILLIIIYFY